MFTRFNKILSILFLFNKPFESIGLDLPNIEFIQEFAMRHDLDYIYVHIPFPLIPLQVIEEYCKNNRKYEISMKCLTSNHFVNINEIVFQNKDLNVFVHNVNDLLRSFETFKRIFNNRKRSRKDYWILDISYFNEPTKLLKDLYLDFDDDLYLFENKSIIEKSDQEVTIFETYKPQDGLPSKFQYYATWSDKEKNLNILNANKWVRRKDLAGVRFKCNAMPGPPYIQKMIPRSNKNGEYQVEGFFSDVFVTLQVSL